MNGLKEQWNRLRAWQKAGLVGVVVGGFLLLRSKAAGSTAAATGTTDYPLGNYPTYGSQPYPDGSGTAGTPPTYGPPPVPNPTYTPPDPGTVPAPPPVYGPPPVGTIPPDPNKVNPPAPTAGPPPAPGVSGQGTLLTPPEVTVLAPPPAPLPNPVTTAYGGPAAAPPPPINVIPPPPPPPANPAPAAAAAGLPNPGVYTPPQAYNPPAFFGTPAGGIAGTNYTFLSPPSPAQPWTIPIQNVAPTDISNLAGLAGLADQGLSSWEATVGQQSPLGTMGDVAQATAGNPQAAINSALGNVQQQGTQGLTGLALTAQQQGDTGAVSAGTGVLAALGYQVRPPWVPAWS